MPPTLRLRLALLVAFAMVAGACSRGAEPGGGGLAGERRAALATLLVENRTAAPLAIAFLYAAEPGGPGGEIGIGTAPAGARTVMAPVPAAEPIILIARGPGSEWRLPPRSLEIDERWTWVVEPNGSPARSR